MIHIVVYQVLLSSQFKLDGVLLAWQIFLHLCLSFLICSVQLKRSKVKKCKAMKH